ncbi:MAG: hypothetical protein HZB59_12950 [Ignavibacteriales bacterium]|nr:hypothetical protein [Ignavibacteriales bacterium]
MFKIFVIYFFLMLIIGTSILPAQTDSTAESSYKITLSDGSNFIGTILTETQYQIKLRTISNIEMIIPKDQIKSMIKYSGEIIFGVPYRSDPNRTRLFFAPTARSLKSGQGYFSDYELFFPMLAVGIADRITLAGGMSLIPGAEEQALYFAPKITAIHSEKFDVAGGVLFIHVPDDESYNFGIAYSVATYGTDRAALTCGLGWGFVEGELADEPIILLGGELRASNSVKFITENWIPPNSGVALCSIGIRFFGDQLAADLGLLTPLGGATKGFPFMPWVGFVYNFGLE